MNHLIDPDLPFLEPNVIGFVKIFIYIGFK